MLTTILLIVLILILIGVFPGWNYSRSWGYAPFSGVGFIVALLLLFLIFGRL